MMLFFDNKAFRPVDHSNMDKGLNEVHKAT